ncbi:MAG TPA: M23 family metallopeptidase [Candidatus Dormibacteraeota bacterium]|nr:M23 family metallopeptidase [Candidatus Dormibacteraeota bacterium]
MKPRSYTLYFATSDARSVRKLHVPRYVVHGLAVLAVVGAVTLGAAVASYSRMLLKVANYNALRSEEGRLKQQYVQLQAQAQNTRQQLSSLQSLATEVAATYGILRWRDTPFRVATDTFAQPKNFESSVNQFHFLVRNVSMVTMVDQSGLSLLPGPLPSNSLLVPSLWPVIGPITASFGEREDPFTDEPAFHPGIDIGVPYGTPVRATADGIVVFAGEEEGYGREVVIDHGFGISSCYAHLSGFNTQVGDHVDRGDVIGYVGDSGRSTGPHLHYEVRIHNTPVNPWPYMRSTTASN